MGGAGALSAAALVLGLSVWKGSPLRKRRQLLEEEMRIAEQGERDSSLLLMGGDLGGDLAEPSLDMDQSIRRGIDLIDRYSVAPTVEALEKLADERRVSNPTSLFDAARLLARTSSVTAEASTANPPNRVSEVSEASSKSARLFSVVETGGD